MADKPGLVQRPLDMSLSNRKACSKLGHSLGGVNQDLTGLWSRINQELLIKL